MKKVKTLVMIGMVIIIGLLSIRQMFCQTALKTAQTVSTQPLASDILSKVEAGIANGDTPAQIYPPGYLDWLDSLGDNPLPSAAPAPKASMAMSAMTMSPNGMNGDNISDPPTYAIIDLGCPDGSQTFYMRAALNDRGQLIGQVRDSSGNYHTLLWQNGTMQDFGSQYYFLGLNNYGQIVGQTGTGSNSYPLLYNSSDGTAHNLNDQVDPASGWVLQAGSGINGAGQIASLGYSNNVSWYCLYHNGAVQGIADLGDYDIQDLYLFPSLYINASGQVAGSYIPSVSGVFLWSDGIFQSITSTNDVLSGACGINDNGQVVGRFSYPYHAFLWQDGVMQDLGTLPGSSDSIAYGINNAGQVVGGGSLFDRAFLWQNGTMYDLNSLLVNTDSGWVLHWALAINNVGQIAGIGKNPQGKGTFFLLNPLPPGALQAASAVQSSLPTYGAIPAPTGDQDSIVVITHGWICQGWPVYGTPQQAVDSVNSLSNSIQQYLIANGFNNWRVYGYMWTDQAYVPVLPGPEKALYNAIQQGKIVGDSIVQGGWKHVHLIAHSAGAGLIQKATEEIRATSTLSPPIVIHETFLDAYDEAFLAFVAEWGYGSDWSDSYFSRDLLTGAATQQPLLHAYNVDVTTLDTNANQEKMPGFVSGGDVNSPCYKTESSHGWPIGFYANTIPPNTPPSEYQGFGFPISEEAGISMTDAKTTYAPGNGFLGIGDVTILGPHDPTCVLYQYSPWYWGTGTSFPDSSTIQSGTGSIQKFLNSLKLTTGSPVWVATIITPTNALNSLSFDAEFTSAAGADGLLSVYWDTNMIGLVDEVAVQPGLQHYTLSFPSAAPATSHVLGFHIDPFTSVHSSITITNIAMGYIGVQSPALSVTTNTSNGFLVWQLSGQPDNYTIQANSDLTTANWVNIALLSNTNGTVNFVDQSSTNYPTRFYRAVAQ